MPGFGTDRPFAACGDSVQLQRYFHRPDEVATEIAGFQEWLEQQYAAIRLGADAAFTHRRPAARGMRSETMDDKGLMQGLLDWLFPTTEEARQAAANEYADMRIIVSALRSIQGSMMTDIGRDWVEAQIDEFTGLLEDAGDATKGLSAKGDVIYGRFDDDGAFDDYIASISDPAELAEFRDMHMGLLQAARALQTRIDEIANAVRRAGQVWPDWGAGLSIEPDQLVSELIERRESWARQEAMSESAIAKITQRLAEIGGPRGLNGMIAALERAA